MVGLDTAIGEVSGLLTTAINKIWPNPEDKAKAEATIMAASADAAIARLKAEQAVMLSEATSSDGWTSRARPSFLYVVYILMLASIPMGICFAIDPTIAMAVTSGFKGWLAAIPDTYLELFGVVMLGYTGGRTLEKIKGVAK